MPACPGCGVDNPERARFCLECGLPLAPARPEVHGSRRTVTVLFSDIVGSTALGELLDPEAVHIVVSSYFDAMRAVIERHGGTVEKFIGDAIMAVFGLPTVHEDDALRAVRAALEMQATLAALNVRLSAERGVTIMTRTGLNTGEVLAGDPSARQTLVTGDAVNTAARLEQAAGAGEIVLGMATWRLVRDVVTVESIPAIEAKGKAEPLPAVRLLSVHRGATRPDRTAAPLVGRDGDLEHLRIWFERVAAKRRPALVTVIGPAGVGKSRLVAEFVAGLDDRATVLKGRCLSYGDGITYWPLREVLHAAAGIRDDDSPEEGGAKLARLLRDDVDRPLLAARLASAIGLSAASFPQDELFWAVRRTLEDLAAERPLVLVLEDIHWAEPTLLDLVEHVVDQASGAPILLVCPARPELVDTAAGWMADRANSTMIVLEGLPPGAMSQLLDSLPGGPDVPPHLRERILATAEGNPLFVEEMVRMLVEDGIIGGEADGGARVLDEVRVPPTIQALMAARIDRLPARNGRPPSTHRSSAGSSKRRPSRRSLPDSHPARRGRGSPGARAQAAPRPGDYPGSVRTRHSSSATSSPGTPHTRLWPSRSGRSSMNGSRTGSSGPSAHGSWNTRRSSAITSGRPIATDPSCASRPNGPMRSADGPPSISGWPVGGPGIAATPRPPPGSMPAPKCCPSRIRRRRPICS